MEFTQQQVLAMLEESGRNRWNVRQMTQLRSEGYLPKLTSKRKPGTNKRLYVWDESDLDQIADVYDWWDYCDGDRGTLTLALWLNGYEVPPAFLRHVYLPIIDAYLNMLTGGMTDHDDILDEVSGLVVTWMKKLKYTPGLAIQRKKMETQQNMSMQEFELVIEKVLSALAVPDEEFVAEALYSPLSNQDEDFVALSQKYSAVLHDICSFPNLRAAVELATVEQWNQAREDFQSICKLFNEFLELNPNINISALPWDYQTNLKHWFAIMLVAPLLSSRFRGFGQWIDIVLKKSHELLTDPEFQAYIRSKHQLRNETAEADQDKET